MKKSIAAVLICFFLWGIIGQTFVKPLPVYAQEEARAKVVGTVGDGLRYYVVFDYKGKTYRSDEMGEAFNINMWNLLDEDDRRTVAQNYAFAPGWRADQFGQAGSAALADWGNEVTGWKAAGEEWEAAMAAKNYSELAAFFGGSSDNLPVGEKTLSQIEGELNALIPEIQDTAEYRDTMKLVEEIKQEYAAGQAVYEKLADIKAKQIGNAFRAGSKLLIKDIIIDNVMVPVITSGSSSVVADGLNFLKDRAADLYDELAEEPEISEVLSIMQEMLDILEQTANALKSSIESKLNDLPGKLEKLQEDNDEILDEENEDITEKNDATNAATEAVFSWSEEAENYEIATVDEDEEETFESNKALVEEEADNIKNAFAGILNEILSRKHDLYWDFLEFDDGSSLTNHPDYEAKVQKNNFSVSSVITGSTYPYIVVDISERIDPGSLFFGDTSYNEAKALIDTEGPERISDLEDGIELLEEYIEAVEGFITDAAIGTGLDSVAEKINGLESLYAHYVNASLQNYVLGELTFAEIRSSLHSMLGNEIFGDDYKLLAFAERQKNRFELNIDNFQNEASYLEAGLRSAAAGGSGGDGYDTLLANLQNSAAFMVGAYNSLNDLHENSSYITYVTSYGQTMPAVDMEYINGLIAAESTETEKEARRQNILAALRSLKEKELEYLHKFDMGLLHCQFDAGQLDRLLAELGLSGSEAAKTLANLEELLGKEIKDSSMYLQQGDYSNLVNQLYLGHKKPQTAGISRALERLVGTSDYYYNAMIISDEIELNSNSLRTMSEEDFSSAYTNYMTKLQESRAASYPLDATQLAKADDQYYRGYMLLLSIKSERDQGSQGSTEILVSSIIPIIKDGGWNAESIGIGVGESWQLSVILLPSNATNQQVLWSSDNENVLTVNADGWIYGVGNGTAAITITSADGNATATSYVRVGTGESGGQEPELPGDTGSGGSGDGSSDTDSSGSSSPAQTPPLTVAGEVQINHTVSGETVSLELPATKLAEIIEKASDKEVVFDLSAMDGITSAELQKEAITDIQKAGLDVALKLPEGTITLNEKTVSSIAEQATGANIKIEFKQASPDSLTSEQKEVVKNGDIVLDINIFSDTKKITNFNGILSVETPYSGPQPVAVWYLNDKGELEKLACTFSNGIVSFELDHLSHYVLGQDKDRTGWVNPFIDVKKTDWFYNAVHYAFERGIMKGTSSSAFSPHDAATRGMIATILHCLEDTPGASTANFFGDVKAGQYYADAVSWAAENKIVSGYSNNKFGPNDPITREQMAVILANYARFKGYDVSTGADLSGFDDADSVSGWALSAMIWTNTEGIIQGDGSKLTPKANAERCQVAAIFQRFIEKYK